VVDSVELVCEILLTKNLYEPLVIVDIMLFSHFSKYALYDLLVLVSFDSIDRKLDAGLPVESKTHQRALPGVLDLGSQAHFDSRGAQTFFGEI